ncbi:MAG: hypothetical protein U0166_28805 [Acidobacteriota bacterium]
MENEEASPVLVVLGASNLHLGLVPFSQALDRALGSEGLMLVAAPGAGRSYGKPAGALGVVYPGHLEAGIVTYVKEAARRGGARLALLMDIGNDVGYGEEPSDILAWVGALRDQLLDLDFAVLIQRLPVESVGKLPRAAFELMRRVYFPRTKLSRAELERRARAVDDGLCTLASHRCEILPSLAPYTGPDGIHAAPWNLPAFWDALGQELVGRLGFPSRDVRLGTRARSLLLGLQSRRVKPRRWARGDVWRDSDVFATRLRHGTTLVRL